MVELVEEMKDAELRISDGDEREDSNATPGDVPSMRSPDDRGGPTSFYQGDVSGIAELSLIYENMINDRDPLEGLKVKRGTSVDDILGDAAR